MRQIWIPKNGGPEVLEVREAEDPRPGAGEVRIRVAASGINFADILARMGLYPDAPPVPSVVGYEVSGEVDAVGEGVEDLAVGDRVVALCRFGGYADVVCVPAQQTIKLGDDMDLVAAAAIPVQYLTAWIMLVELGNVREGHQVLVHAAAGGVGQAATQICRWKGAEVFGTASPGKHERLKQMGVTHCIDYRSQDFEAEVQRLTNGKGVDIALDAVGGDSFNKSLRCLRPMGRLFMFGISSFAPGQTRRLLPAVKGFFGMKKFSPITLMNDNRGVFGVNLGHLWEEQDRIRVMFQSIVDRVGDGTFEPVVDKTFSFDEASAAHTYIQERKNFGKVLLTT